LFEFHCTVIDTNNCESADTINVYISEHVGISLYISDKIDIYPNPNDGKFIIGVSKLPDGIFNFSLYDSFGKEKMTKKLNVLDQQEIPIDVGFLPEGIYYLKLSGENITVNKKLLIK